MLARLHVSDHHGLERRFNKWNPMSTKGVQLFRFVVIFTSIMPHGTSCLWLGFYSLLHLPWKPLTENHLRQLLEFLHWSQYLSVSAWLKCCFYVPFGEWKYLPTSNPLCLPGCTARFCRRLHKNSFNASLNIGILKVYTNGLTIEFARWRTFTNEWTNRGQLL